MDINRNWLNIAQAFYDCSVKEKSSLKRQTVFIKSYQKLVNKLGISKASFVLDLGCGCGEVTGAIENSCHSVLGLDVSFLSLKKAKEFYPNSIFLSADMENLPFNVTCFDVITAITSIEFCYDKRQVLSEIKRVLKKNGFAYIEVRNGNFFMWKILRLLPLNLDLVKDYPAENFYDLTFEQWVTLFQQRGFKIKSLHCSIRPWNFGSLNTRFKNLLIKIVYYFFPLRYHYMIGFLLEV